MVNIDSEQEYRFCSKRKCEHTECVYYIRNAPYDIKLVVSDMGQLCKGKCKNLTVKNRNPLGI